MGLGIGFELAKGMQFGEDVESEQACLIDDEERLDFLVDAVRTMAWRMMRVRTAREKLLVSTSRAAASWR